MSKIMVRLKPEFATLTFTCTKPENWDIMDSNEKLEYFENNKKYSGSSISTFPHPDWCINNDIDFIEIGE